MITALAQGAQGLYEIAYHVPGQALRTYQMVKRIPLSASPPAATLLPLALAGFALLFLLMRAPRRNIGAAERRGLPNRLLAYPEEEKLPIDTAGRTRAAMSRFSQTGFASKAAQKRAFKRIVRRAENLGIDSSGFESRWAGRLR